MIGELAGLGAQAGLGIIGELMSGKDKEEQRRLMQKALEQYGSIDVPALEKVLAEEMGPGQMEGLTSDPALKQTQTDALNELMRLSKSGGLNLEDKSALNSIRSNAATQAQRGIGGIRENMAARGISGGGQELAMSLSANQGAAQRASKEGLDVAAQAQKRALDSLMAGGRMAGEMRGQDFGERSKAAEAADLRNRYNTDARTSAARYNASLPSQRFGMQMQKANGMAGALGAQAGQAGQNAQSTRDLYGGLGSAAHGAGSAYDQDTEYEAWKRKQKGGY